ncbi:MAG: DUF4870 domain-containing protein [Alphaproteobacteria bacterium]|nr:DUF4870 domain-containing protein [Alphaproteobacteria bacterium]
MTDTQTPHQPEPNKDRRTVVLVYILLLIGLFTGGLASIAAAVVAHSKSGTLDPVYESHLTYQIRTFWFGIAMGIVGTLLMIVLIGWIILIWVLIWTLVRCIKGFTAANDEQPITNPQTFLW